MKEKLKHQLRTFLIGMSFPVLFSSGCSRIEERVATASFLQQSIIDGEKLRDNLFEAFEKYFVSNDLGYTALESLLNDDEIAEIIDSSKTTTECDFVWDGDIEKVKETIKNNSTDFLKIHSEFESAFYQAGINDYDLFRYQMEFETVFDDVMNDFVMSASNDINEDICKIQTLSIVFGEMDGNSSTMAYYQDDTNTIVLCYKSMLETYKYTNEDFFAFLTQVLSHELNHTRQLICEDRLQRGQQYRDVCYADDVSFIIESSAESALYNINDSSLNGTGFTYPYERKCEALLFLYAICNEQAEIKDYYNAIFDTDLEKFYEFLGCESEEDIYSFYKILGSMDASLGRNKNLDSSIKTVGDAKKFIGDHYMINLFHHILSDMVDYTCNHSDFSLEDNLTLFKIVRTILVENSYNVETDSNGNLERIYDSEFVTSFKESEDMYYAFLSVYYQTDISEMEQIEESYANEMLTSVSYISNTEDVSSYYFDAISFLDRFPLLEPIFKTTYISSLDYDTFVENNSNIYQKKK